MVMIAIFGLVVVIMVCGGMLLTQLATVAKPRRHWLWRCRILIALIWVPLFLLGLRVWFLFYSTVSPGGSSPFG